MCPTVKPPADDGCIYTGSRWYCPHDCDDPSHGHPGHPRIYYQGHYYRPGQLIDTTPL